jgi:hypothetical protein
LRLIEPWLLRRESADSPNVDDGSGLVGVEFQHIQQIVAAIIGHITDAVTALIAAAQQVAFDAGWV